MKQLKELIKIAKNLAIKNGLICYVVKSGHIHPRIIFINSDGQHRFVVISGTPKGDYRSRMNELHNIKKEIDYLLSL